MSKFINLSTKYEWGKFTWCLNCEKVSTTKNVARHSWNCPVCNASIFNLYDWSDKNSFPRAGNPDYPENPMEGQHYPLYR